MWSPLIRSPRSQPSMRVASTPASTPVHHLLQQIWFKEASRPHPAEDARILDCGTSSFGRPICISILASSSSSTTSSDFAGVPTPFKLSVPKALALFGSNAASLSVSGLSDRPFVVGLGFSPVAGKMVAQIVFGKYVDLNNWAEGCRSLALGSVSGSFRTSRLVVFPRWVLVLVS